MALTRVIVRLATTQRQTETRRTLDGVDYRLRFRYVRETGRWTLTVMDANGVALVSGIRVVLGIDLLAPYHYLKVPPGQLFAYDTSRPTSPTDPVFIEPGLDDLDARVLILYRPAAEVVSA